MFFSSFFLSAFLFFFFSSHSKPSKSTTVYAIFSLMTDTAACQLLAVLARQSSSQFEGSMKNLRDWTSIDGWDIIISSHLMIFIVKLQLCSLCTIFRS